MTFRSPFANRLHDYQTVEYTTSVPAKEQVELHGEVVQPCRHSEKQPNVTREPMED